MTVRIGFCSDKKNILSRIIRWMTQSPVSHVFFVVSWGGVDVMVEATWSGFHVRDFGTWKEAHGDSLTELFAPRVDLQRDFDALIPYLGQPYDLGGLFGMVVVYLGRWLKRKWANPWDSDKALFCSEAIAQVLLWAKYPGWSMPAENVSPADLFEFFVNEVNTNPMKS